MSLSLPYIAILLGLAVSAGYLCFYFIAFFLIPGFQKREAANQRRDMLAEATRQRERILEEQKKLHDTQQQLLEEDLSDELTMIQEDFRLLEVSLQAMSQRDEELEAKLVERESEVARYEEKVRFATDKLIEEKNQLEKHSEEVVDKISQVAGLSRVEVLERSRKKLVDEKQVEIVQSQKHELEVLNSIAGKRAARMLDSVLSRYSPEFYWPKPINIVDVPKGSLYEQFSSGSLLAELSEHCGVSITLLEEEEKSNTKAIKVVGGYGIAKEASRLTLEKIISEGKISQWKHVLSLYSAYFESLTEEAKDLGKQAVLQLGLEGVHPELQKLVGALNWRTSYRQNQWYHTVEVSTLAGILAHEMGEDPDEAKRVGLLHDIGKVLDYKINTSHAIISGDYADLYGEKRVICDTVMSHHADLVVETPLAYILQTADCLSGARPGARVNLEEGYQIRLSAIQEAIHSFPGVADVAIMNGGREVHVQVINKKVSEKALPDLTRDMARKIEEMVNYPGQIKVMVTRTFESVKVA